MSTSNEKIEKLDSRALSNTLYILIQNQAEGRIKNNYSSWISNKFELSQGGVSNNLKRLENANLITGQKQGRKKVYKIDWEGLSKLAFTQSESMYYFDHPEEELYEFELPPNEEADNVGGIYDEFLDVLEDISESKQFEEFLQKVMISYAKRLDIERSEGGRFKNPSLSVFFKELISVLSENGYFLKNQIEAIAEESNISEEKALETLQVEEGKKEFLALLKRIWYQHNYVEGGYPPELEKLHDIIVEEFDDYFDVYSKNQIMIEKDFLDRLP